MWIWTCEGKCRLFIQTLLWEILFSSQMERLVSPDHLDWCIKSRVQTWVWLEMQMHPILLDWVVNINLSQLIWYIITSGITVIPYHLNYKKKSNGAAEKLLNIIKKFNLMQQCESHILLVRFFQSLKHFPHTVIISSKGPSERSHETSERAGENKEKLWYTHVYQLPRPLPKPGRETLNSRDLLI